MRIKRKEAQPKSQKAPTDTLENSKIGKIATHWIN
jgi:hypothetical protein